MNKIITLVSKQNPIKVAFPPVLVTSNGKQYYFESSPHKTNREESKKERTEYQLFKDTEGNYVIYESTKTYGVQVFPSQELKNIVFPVTMFKDAAFVRFIKDNQLDKSKLSYIVHHDESETLRCLSARNGLHLYSDGLLLVTHSMELANGQIATVHAIEHNDKISFVTDADNVGSDQFETYTLTKQQLDYNDADYNFHYSESRQKLAQAFFEVIGFKFKNKVEEKKKTTFDCKITAESKIEFPLIVEAQYKGEMIDVAIHGEIIAERDFARTELPFSITVGKAQTTPMRVMAYKHPTMLGIGFVLLNVLEDGKLGYVDNAGLTEFKSALGYDHDMNGNYVIFQVLYDILRKQGVENPENYVGLVSGDAESHPHSEKAFVLDDERVIYGERKFTLSLGRGKEIAIFEQFGQVIPYLLDSSELKSHIGHFFLDGLPQVLNKLSVKGGKHAYYAEQVIEYLISKDALN